MLKLKKIQIFLEGLIMWIHPAESPDSCDYQMHTAVGIPKEQ